MQPHNLKISDRTIDSSKYTFDNEPTNDYQLLDKVLCYFDGINRKIVPLSVMLTYPILYDTYDDENDKVHDISIVLCPFTLASVVLYGKFVPTENVDHSSLVVTDTIDTFSVLNSFDYIHKTKRKLNFEVDIKILRNVFTEYPDSKYFVPNSELIFEPLLPLDYYTNDTLLFDSTNESQTFHPKTLVYLIIYISSKDHKQKASVIVGSDSNNYSITLTVANSRIL